MAISSNHPSTLFFRLLDAEDKGTALKENVAALPQRPMPEVFAVNPELFEQVPKSPFAYWTSEGTLKKFTEFEPLENNLRKGKLGLNTTDDSRFLRLWFEIDPSKMNSQWFMVFKGGGYSPFFKGSNLVIDWKNKGEKLKEYIIAVLGGMRYVQRPVTLIQQGSSCTSFDQEPLY